MNKLSPLKLCAFENDIYIYTFNWIHTISIIFDLKHLKFDALEKGFFLRKKKGEKTKQIFKCGNFEHFFKGLPK